MQTFRLARSARSQPLMGFSRVSGKFLVIINRHEQDHKVITSVTNISQSSFPHREHWSECTEPILFVWPRYTATFLGFSTLSELALDSPHWTRRHHFSNSNFSHAKLLWNHSTAQHHRYSAKSFSHFTKRTSPHSFISPETVSQTTVV